MTIASVTFYGYDQAGNAVAVTGLISVNFADWADEEQPVGRRPGQDIWHEHFTR